VVFRLLNGRISNAVTNGIAVPRVFPWLVGGVASLFFWRLQDPKVAWFDRHWPANPKFQGELPVFLIARVISL
jgi:hypothetical protein